MYKSYIANMQNHRLVDIAHLSPKLIIKRLINQCDEIFQGFHELDYRNVEAALAKLMQQADSLSEDMTDALKEFIACGICAIARNFGNGEPVHPGTMNIVIQAIQAYNAASPNDPFQFGDQECPNVTVEGLTFLMEVVLPIVNSPNLELFALHHRPWTNDAHEAREAARRAAEEAPPAETRAVKTLTEFRALGGEGMERACPICMEEFVEEVGPSAARSGFRRSAVFMPVVIHKDMDGKWRHPIHMACTHELKKCAMCRDKVAYPKLRRRLTYRRPKSSPLRSVKRSTSKRSTSKRSTSKHSTSKRSAHKRITGTRSPSIKRRSADF